MTTAQVLFSIALGIVSLLVVAFAAYVVSSTVWGDRWTRHGGSGDVDEP